MDNFSLDDYKHHFHRRFDDIQLYFKIIQLFEQINTLFEYFTKNILEFLSDTPCMLPLEQNIRKRSIQTELVDIFGHLERTFSAKPEHPRPEVEGLSILFDSKFTTSEVILIFMFLSILICYKHHDKPNLSSSAKEITNEKYWNPKKVYTLVFQ
ncbi:hypothetical protein FF38_01884 [Lucilia cuprina]|uniref:Uncharacterized protein n=1 Tax=Lucilia cuprina TaxID=7375 RepID=A0A0L0BQ49_LUCCU|nr:hypothetical protein FF38_01884 [Lucilia cuprina]